MRKLNLFLGVLIGFTILSCSSDDDNPSTEVQNGFSFEDNFYSTQYAFINDENVIDNTPSDISIILMNMDPFQTTQSSGVNFVYIDFQAVTIESGTISDIPDYQILENAELDNLQVSGGNTLLDDSQNGYMSSNSTIIINSISNTTIDFDYSFTREDGKLINGNYNGVYTDLSN